MKFFKALLAATLGSIAAFMILIFICGIIIAGIIAGSTSEPEPYVSENTVLTIEINGSLPARSVENPFEEILNPAAVSEVSLNSLKENLAKAAVDDNIEGVLLKISFLSEGWANLQEAHKLISTFRKASEKFVYAMTGDIGYNEKAYYLATAADSIFSPPHSFFEFDGFYTQVTFYDQLLDNIGIDPEIAKHGLFKSAVEPFYLTELSEPSEFQLTQLIENVNGMFLEEAGKETRTTVAELVALINEQPRMTAEFGFKYGLIDSLLYPHELKALINERISIEEADEMFETISNSDYAMVSEESAGLEIIDSDHEIAVLYASGIIMPRAGGFPLGEREVITANSFRDQLEEIKDEEADALVIRINSPGGSGSTSDLIWQMVSQTAQEIPVIVSMGPVAASGGYYIAMAADTIVAQPTTITGSIGVFATKFNAQKLFNEELGITFDEVKSNPHADWLSYTRGFTPSEAKAFQQYVDEFYLTFITKVAKSRDMSVEAVDEVAGGRVWSGEAALAAGLVDVLGGLDKALAIAADKADIENYKIITFPEPKTLFEMFMGTAQVKAQAFLGELFFGKEHMKTITKPLSLMKKRNMLLLYPYEITIR